MKKKITKKTIGIFLAAVFFLCGSVYVTAIAYGKMSAAYQEGLKKDI